MFPPRPSFGSRLRRLWPLFLLIVRRRALLVLGMGVLGAMAGLAISMLTPKVYYASAVVNVPRSIPSMACTLPALPSPRVLTRAERIGRSIDSAAARAGFTTTFEQRMTELTDE